MMHAAAHVNRRRVPDLIPASRSFNRFCAESGSCQVFGSEISGFGSPAQTEGAAQPKWLRVDTKRHKVNGE
jgi:hypothetical protein